MSPSGGDDDVDLRPWAAYVLGRHPRTLHLRYSDFWMELISSKTSVDPGPWDRIPEEIEELDRALRILAEHGRLVTGPHDTFRKSLEEFRAIHFDMIRWINDVLFNGSDRFDPDGINEPAYAQIYDLAHESSSLITAGDGLGTWRAFGEAVATLQSPVDFDVQLDPPPLTVVKRLAGKLRADDKYPLLDEVADLADVLDLEHPCYSYDRPSEPDGILGGELDRLDRSVREHLLRKAPRTKLLELDRNQLVFFGARFCINKLPWGPSRGDFKGVIPKAEATFLWVLAKRPGKWVPRKTIRDEGELSRGCEELQFYAARLRKLLKKPKAIERYYSLRTRDLPEHAGSCFIVGDRGKNALSGEWH